MALEQFFTGKHLYSVVLTPKVRAADGTLSGAVSYTLISSTSATAGVLEGCIYNGRNLVEDLTPISSPRENLVPVHRDDSVTLVEIMRRGGTGNLNLLAEAFMTANAEYAEVIIRRGITAATTGKVVTVTFTALMSEYREVIRSGKKTASLELLIVEIEGATNNPTASVDTIS